MKWSLSEYATKVRKVEIQVTKFYKDYLRSSPKTPEYRTMRINNKNLRMLLSLPNFHPQHTTKTWERIAFL